MSPNTLQILCKLYVVFLENEQVVLVNELVDFHSDTVNPKVLTISSNFTQGLAGEEPIKKCPFSLMYLLEA